MDLVQGVADDKRDVSQKAWKVLLLLAWALLSLLSAVLLSKAQGQAREEIKERF